MAISDFSFRGGVVVVGQYGGKLIAHTCAVIFVTYTGAYSSEQAGAQNTARSKRVRFNRNVQHHLDTLLCCELKLVRLGRRPAALRHRPKNVLISAVDPKSILKGDVLSGYGAGRNRRVEDPTRPMTSPRHMGKFERFAASTRAAEVRFECRQDSATSYIHCRRRTALWPSRIRTLQ